MTVDLKGQLPFIDSWSPESLGEGPYVYHLGEHCFFMGNILTYQTDATHTQKCRAVGDNMAGC